MRKGNEEEESDEVSYLAVLLLLRVRSCQFDMSLSGRVERSAWAKVQDVSTNAATRLQALHPFLGAFGQVEMQPGRQRDTDSFEAIQPGFET